MSKYKFDIGIVDIEVNIPEQLTAYRNKGGRGEPEPFRTVSFKNLSTGVITKHDCYQEDILDDIKNDVRYVSVGRVQGTQFYKHWMKLLFKSKSKTPSTFALIQKGGGYVQRYQGEYAGQHKHQENTFYFIVNGEKVKASDYYYEANTDNKYEL